MKRIIVIIITAVMIAGLASCSGQSPADVIEGTFRYMPAFEDVTEEIFTYSDSWFSESSYADDTRLMLMSCGLALSTFEIRDCSYVTALYKDTGFTDISVADMIEETSKDSIGTAIARKKIGKYNLIAVAIRGEKYELEWASNFIVGRSGNAAGFDDASLKVIERIRDYINERDLKDNKIWITGYSRAGAVADLAGVYINNNLSEFGTTGEDLFIYAFEPPAACADDTVYQNINIVVNRNDPVIYVYPESWGLYTNGKITDISTSQRVMTYTDLMDPQEYLETDMDTFLGESFGWLAGRISREKFAEELEGPLSELLGIFFSKTEDEREKILSFLKDDVLDTVMNDPDKKGPLMMIVWSAISHYSEYTYGLLGDMIAGYMDEARAEGKGSVLTDTEYSTVTDILRSVIRTLGPVIVDDMHYCPEVGYDSYYETFLPDYNIGDYELGASAGSDLGSSFGYEAGFSGEEADPSPVGADETYGPVYYSGFEEAYIRAYEEYYELGLSHAADLSERGRYDGERNGERDGFTDGRYGEERAENDRYFWEEDWMTEEYISAYNEAYLEHYNTAYDQGINDTSEELPDPEIRDSYHVISFAKNISDIMKNHYGQTNLALIRLWAYQ